MIFYSKKELSSYLKNLKFIAEGSQGACYYRNSDKMILKIFHGYDEYDYSSTETEKRILRFSDIKNNTFIWPIEVIKVKDEIVGYIAPYVKADNLYKKDPLRLNLDSFEKSILRVRKDIHTLSTNGIATFDMMYNNLYRSKFYVIDQDEYSFNDIDPTKLEKNNNMNFDYELYYFLIDGYFNGIVSTNKELNDMYKHKKENILEFIKIFRNRINELLGKEISCLSEAKQLIDENQRKHEYIRELKKDF